MNKNQLIERIREARKLAGLSARELSLRIYKNEAYISRLESAQNSFEPSISTLLDIIQACGMTEYEFFYPKKIENYKRDSKIIELLKNTNPEIRDAVIKILEHC